MTAITHTFASWSGMDGMLHDGHQDVRHRLCVYGIGQREPPQTARGAPQQPTDHDWNFFQETATFRSPMERHYLLHY